MKKTSFAFRLLPLLSVLILTSCSNKESHPESEGWVSLFNGINLSGWEFKVDEAKSIWSVIDGVIDCEPNLKMKGDKSLWSTKSYYDFTLHVEWRLKELKGIYNLPTVLPDGSYQLDADGEKVINPGPGADSGIYVRGTNKAQINIWNWAIGSGEVYSYRNNQKDPVIRAGVTPKVNADNPIGEWNTFIITMKGDRLTVDLNGKRVLDNAQLPGVPESGPVVLQHHGGYNHETKEWSGASSLVQFRNLHIKEL
ncbi:MAG: DUF1080 domain-containing protein [Opitutales bacterium]